MPNVPRIVFISHGNTFNGAELCLTESVKALKDHRDGEIHVFLERGGKYLKNLLIEYGAIVHDVSKNPRWIGQKLNWWAKAKLLWRSVQSLREYFLLIGRIKPDVVISNSIVCSPAAGLAARLRGAKHIWYIHELGDADHGYQFYLGKRLTWKVVHALSAKVLFNSAFTRSHFLKSPQSVGISPILYYGVPIDRLKQGAPNFDRTISARWDGFSVWRILVSGRTSPGKGQLDIVQAVGILKAKYGIDNFFLTILGRVKGEYADQLERLVAEFSLEQHVEIIPFMEDPGGYYLNAHIGVTTSRNEAFGRVTVEYMKSCMVVIGADAGGTREIIDRCGSGALYPVGDCDKLAEVLCGIMRDPASAEVSARTSQQAANECFNLSRHAAELWRVLELSRS